MLFFSMLGEKLAYFSQQIAGSVQTIFCNTLILMNNHRNGLPEPVSDFFTVGAPGVGKLYTRRGVASSPHAHRKGGYT